MSLPEVTIIGTGGLGQAFVRALSEAQIPIKSIFNRTVDRAQNIAAEHNISIFGQEPDHDGQLGKLIFITVADRAIQKIVTKLSMFSDDFNGYTVVHCSGNESAELLQSLRSKGAKVASFHPLQTFTERSDATTFNDIYFSLQGDEAAFPILRDIAKQIGAQALEVTADQKQNLHAAAVMASNYLNTLLEGAVNTGSLSGLPEGEVKKALLPLVKTTLQNIEDSSFTDALSGPIKRGDIETVKHHLDLLKNQSELKNIYQMLGKRTVELARKSQNIDSKTAQKLRSLLS